MSYQDRHTREQKVEFIRNYSETTDYDTCLNMFSDYVLYREEGHSHEAALQLAGIYNPNEF